MNNKFKTQSIVILKNKGVKSMKLRNLFLLMLITSLFIINTGCSKSDSPTEPPVTLNEAKILAEYLEANGDYINTSAPAIMTAQEIRDMQLANPTKIYVIDIRSASDYSTKGHIPGAINVAIKDIVTHIKSITTSSYDRIAVACYSGQTAGYAVSLLRLLGYTNVYSMKWGMTSWNASCGDSWSTSIGNNYTGLVTTATAKAAAGELPTLNTGKTTGKEILEARITQLLSSADPFGDIKITWGTVTGSLSNYYIVNYWPQAQYDLGHLPGAIQYTPKSDLKLSNNLKTLPTNKTIVLYCYTGQTSAQVVTYLKLLGYDAKSLLFGINVLSYDWAKTNSLSPFVAANEIKTFPFNTGVNP
jgi:rhodanese-related sulfurtransferase